MDSIFNDFLHEPGTFERLNAFDDFADHKRQYLRIPQAIDPLAALVQYGVIAGQQPRDTHYTLQFAQVPYEIDVWPGMSRAQLAGLAEFVRSYQPGSSYGMQSTQLGKAWLEEHYPVAPAKSGTLRQ